MGDGQSGRLCCREQQGEAGCTSKEVYVVAENWYDYKALAYRMQYVQKKGVEGKI